MKIKARIKEPWKSFESIESMSEWINEKRKTLKEGTEFDVVVSQR